MKKQPKPMLAVRIEWDVAKKVRESASKNRRTFQSEVNVLLNRAMTPQVYGEFAPTNAGPLVTIA